MLNRTGKKVIAPHPFYPNDPEKQKKLDYAVRCGWIERIPSLQPGKVQYTLTIQGDAKWLLEEMMKK